MSARRWYHPIAILKQSLSKASRRNQKIIRNADRIGLIVRSHILQEQPRVKQRADRDTWGRIALSAILLVIFFTPASADDTFVLWKVYAGKFNSKDTEYVQWDEAKKNALAGAVISDVSEIECGRRARFGIIYVVFFEKPSPANFEATMHYPHLAKEKDGDTSHMRRKTIRRPPGKKFTLDTYIWSLDKDEMKDGDFELILHRDETVFIRHVFKVRGCNSS